MQEVGLIWIGLMTIWAFGAMGFDKRQARMKSRRIPEKTLWLLAIIGGGIGAYLGMQVFKHKTRRTNFRVGFLMLMIIYGALVLYLLGVNVPGIRSI